MDFTELPPLTMTKSSRSSEQVFSRVVMALVQKGVFSCPHDPAPDIPPRSSVKFSDRKLVRCHTS